MLPSPSQSDPPGLQGPADTGRFGAGRDGCCIVCNRGHQMKGEFGTSFGTNLWVLQCWEIRSEPCLLKVLRLFIVLWNEKWWNVQYCNVDIYIYIHNIYIYMYIYICNPSCFCVINGQMHNGRWIKIVWTFSNFVPPSGLHANNPGWVTTSQKYFALYVVEGKPSTVWVAWCCM